MNRIYVIGSGFSSCGGAPVLQEVLPQLFHNEVDNQLSNLKTYLQTMLFPKQQDEWIYSSTLEEILSRLDLIKIYHPYQNIDYAQVSYYEDVLLQKFTALLSPGSTEWRKPEYLKFKDFLKTDDIVISFNYDLIIEKLLKESNILYDYCLYSAKSDENMPNTLKLIKLHGSVNQYYCSECGHILFDEAVMQTKRSCPLCLKKGIVTKVRQLIIAPTLFKSYSLPVLRDLWFKTLEYLSTAKEIVFIGYSLPEADVLAYQLFDFGYKSSGKNHQVLLVNGHHLSPERFETIYGENLYNTGLYFEEWIAHQRRLP